MKNFRHEGRTMTVLAPAALASGEGFFMGATFLVAVKAALITAPVAGYRLGVFQFAAVAADAWGQGDKLYWVIADKKLTDVGANGVLIGVADAPKIATATTGLVCLSGHPV